MPINSKFKEEDKQFDREHIWHPYTSLSESLPVYPIASAEGVRLTMDDGTKLIDGMASWWTAIHGYNHPKLNKAAIDQLCKMSHVMFGGITHQPAIDLAKLLVDITPSGLDKVFFADSGSVSVEVAMKMAIQYQQAKGNLSKSKFLTVKFGYHGDTTGAMSVCDPVSGMHHIFKDFIPSHIFGPAFDNGYADSKDSDDILELETLFKTRSEEIAAFIVEPIVQGAGGMRIYSPDYLKLVKILCEKYDILFIADEIATGFGRTGKLFASEHADCTPDIMCLGKALTGGYLTLAATLCTEAVAQVICSGESGVFMHGPTFMANPLACSIAIKSIELLMESSWQKNIERIETLLHMQLQLHDKIKEIRIIGAIGILEFHQQINVSEAQKFFVSRSVWIRPFRNLLYIMPPYIITNEELATVTSAMMDMCEINNCFIP